MNLAEIRCLVDANHSADALTAAEQALLNNTPMPFDVPGETVGDKLTNVLGARWVQRYRDTNQCSSADALREFASIVRKSIAP